MRFPQLAVVFLVLSVASPAYSADVILNEYNAVGSSKQLDKGDGRDPFFGTIDGNGGNWFELLVIGDHVDMRGWSLQWTEDEKIGEGEETAAGTLTLSNDAIWSDLRSGSILTFSETSDANGTEGISTATDSGYAPLDNDWWIHVATREEQVKGASALVTTTTNDGSPGEFSVGKDDWTLAIIDSATATVFGPAGEGIGDTWAGDGVGNTEGGSLEGPVATAETPLTLAVWQSITPANDAYDDTSSTSFGAANVDYDSDTASFTTIQDLSALRNQIVPPGGIAGDFDKDGILTANDIDLLSAAVRSGDQADKFDVNKSGNVDATDRETWVVDLKRTYFGDSNLDGEFGSSDFVVVFAASEFEDATVGNSTWATGDWDGDGDFTTSDLVAAFREGGFEKGPRTAAQAVPEPTGLGLMLISLLSAFVFRRRLH